MEVEKLRDGSTSASDDDALTVLQLAVTIA